MKSPEQLEEKLRKLMTEGTVPASQCGKAFLIFIKPLIEGEALAWQRSGAGRCLTILETEVVKRFYRRNFPNAEVTPDAGSRITGLAKFRDSKAMASTDAEIVSLRVWKEGVLLQNGKPVAAVDATANHGVFSFLFSDDNAYELRSAIALVENPAVFAKAERLDLGVSAVMYGNGRISNRLLEWLVNHSGPQFTLLHLPDYDPLGLNEFLRLSARLGNRIKLYLPEDLETKFQEFSKTELLKKERQQFFLSQLRRSTDPSVRRVVALIDRHNAGLEQEALLVVGSA